MNTPDKKIVRNALAALVIGAMLAASHLIASAGATEIAADGATAPADRPAQTALANLAGVEEESSTGVSRATWTFEGQRDVPQALLDVSTAQSADEATDAASRRPRDADSLDVGSLTAWLPAAANLSYVDAGLVDSFVTAIAAIRASGAAQLVCDTLWELQDLDGPTRSVAARRLELDFGEHDSFVAAEVAFVLGDVTAPAPDVVFLAFVILQSLWGLACRPRHLV